MEVDGVKNGARVLPVGAETERDLFLVRLLRDIARFWRGSGHRCLVDVREKLPLTIEQS